MNRGKEDSFLTMIGLWGHFIVIMEMRDKWRREIKKMLNKQ
jgi:hypothetical protein